METQGPPTLGCNTCAAFAAISMGTVAFKIFIPVSKKSLPALLFSPSVSFSVVLHDIRGVLASALWQGSSSGRAVAW